MKEKKMHLESKTTSFSAKNFESARTVSTFLTLLLVVMSLLITTSGSPVYAASSSSVNEISQAKAALAVAGALKPVEGTDTSIQAMAQNIVNKATYGVTVKVTSSTNPQIQGSTIIYGNKAASGTVTFALTKKRLTYRQINLVEVPASTILSPTVPTPSPVPVPAPAPAPTPAPTDTTTIAADALYVSATGNDSSSGTAAAPFRTIQKAADTAAAGDTVYIKGGTYREEVVIKHSGSASNYITFTNYPGESVIVDGTGFGYSSWGYSLIDLNGQDYVKINGIKVQNSIYCGIGSFYNFSDKSYNSGSNYVTISNCTTDKTGSSGIIFHSGTGLVITNNKISHSNSTGDQEALTLCTSTDFTISGNEITASDKTYGEGIDCKQGCKNGNIYDNYIHDMPNMGIYIDAAGLATSEINIYNNTMTNLGDGVRLCNEWANSADFGYINVYGNKITNCDRGLNIENGEGNYPIHNITYRDNVTINISDVTVRCLLPSSFYTNCSFN